MNNCFHSAANSDLRRYTQGAMYLAPHATEFTPARRAMDRPTRAAKIAEIWKQLSWLEVGGYCPRCHRRRYGIFRTWHHHTRFGHFKFLKNEHPFNTGGRAFAGGSPGARGWAVPGRGGGDARGHDVAPHLRLHGVHAAGRVRVADRPVRRAAPHLPGAVPVQRSPNR